MTAVGNLATRHLAIANLALIAGLMFAAGGAARAQTGQLEVTNVWARATPGRAATGVAYLTVSSPTADRLVSASTPVARRAELHTTTVGGSMAGMVMQMRRISGIDIAAGRPVTLKPGGLHIMLVGLRQPLQAGQSFPLTVTFQKAGARTVTVAVEKPGAMGPAMAPPH